MRRLLALPALTAVPLLCALFACGKTVNIDPGGGDGGTADGVAPPTGGDGGDTLPDGAAFHNASKVDLLFAIDNSASMGDKQALLRQAVPDLLQRLVAPSCLDASGAVVGPSVNGVCDKGKIEFLPVTDIHIGIVSSSLGERGGDVCDGTNPVGQGSTRHDDDKAHLLTRAGDDEHVLADAPGGFVGWSPAGGAAAVIKDVQDLVTGVHEYGCGLEAQLESWYRFLVQPDPYESIGPDPKDGRKRALIGVDKTILQQRHDFLRPDSLVVVVMITDEDDSTHDPRAIGGQGWAYAMKRFPGSVGGGAARGTSACDNPKTIGTAACTSCGFPGQAADPNCQKPGDTDPNTGQPQAGYYKVAEDTLNTRFTHMKERYGVDPQFPVSRYVNGLTSTTAPDRSGEMYTGVTTDGKPANTYVGTNDCTNPLFAQNLPTDPNGDLCHLQPGPRYADQIVFTAITGVPWQLLTENPADPNSPFKNALSAADWTKIVGVAPEVYDYTGQDPHMVPSITPRAGLADPSQGDTADPMHGREWITGGYDLQYACTFPLAQPKDCTDKRFAGACDCTSGSGPLPPLCAPNPSDGNRPTLQVRGKAYPGTRHLTVAKDLGTQGVVASLCPRSLDPGRLDYGYRPAVRALVDRLRRNLTK